VSSFRMVWIRCIFLIFFSLWLSTTFHVLSVTKPKVYS